MAQLRALIPLLLLGLPGCAPGPPATLPTAAGGLEQRILVLDTHVDVPYRLKRRWADLGVRSQEGHFDLVRAREGGLDAAFLSIYVPSSYQDRGGARAEADALLDLVDRVVADLGGRAALARSPAEVRANFRRGVFSFCLGIENGAAVERDLGNLEHFHRRGVRYVTLAHSRANAICDSSYDEERAWGGLSPFGREVVREMNRLGMMVDISHVSDAAFWQVLEVSEAPVIASHSSCRAFTPGWERNLSDEMIVALARRGGVVQINFGSMFLSDAARRQSERAWREIGRRLAERGLEPGSKEARELVEAYWAEHPRVRTTIDDVVRHVDHVVALVGVEHVGFGSDFDGVGSLPEGLGDVSGYRRLIEALLRRGYGEAEIAAMAGGNLLRVWEEVERTALRLRREVTPARTSPRCAASPTPSPR